MYNTIKIKGSQTNAYIMATREDADIIQEDKSNTHGASDMVIPDSWSLNTIMLATYNGTDTLLSASNYSLSFPVWGFRIFREENEALYLVADTTQYEKQVYDFNTKANTETRFYIYPKYKDKSGNISLLSPIITETIVPNWDGWSVIGLVRKSKNHYTIDKSNIWNFQLNIESGSFGDNVNRQVHNTYSRFPKIVYGKQRFQEGSLRCLLGLISANDCEYIDSSAMMEKWDNFVHNGEPKLLKNTKGQVYVVDIHNSEFNIMDNYHNEAVELSFDFVQLADTNEVRAYLISND